MKVLAVLSAILIISGSYVAADRAYRHQAKPVSHYMRYCPAPNGNFPAHPCADDEDPDEVIQA